MSIGGEARQVRTDLSEYLDGRNALDTIDGAQQGDLVFVRSGALLEQRIVTRDLLESTIEARDLIAKHKAMVLFENDVEGELQFGQFPS
jgi:hypothetical protein